MLPSTANSPVPIQANVHHPHTIRAFSASAPCPASDLSPLRLGERRKASGDERPHSPGVVECHVVELVRHEGKRDVIGGNQALRRPSSAWGHCSPAYHVVPDTATVLAQARATSGRAYHTLLPVLVPAAPGRFGRALIPRCAGHAHGGDGLRTSRPAPRRLSAVRGGGEVAVAGESAARGPLGLGDLVLVDSRHHLATGSDLPAPMTIPR